MGPSIQLKKMKLEKSRKWSSSATYFAAEKIVILTLIPGRLKCSFSKRAFHDEGYYGVLYGLLGQRIINNAFCDVVQSGLSSSAIQRDSPQSNLSKISLMIEEMMMVMMMMMMIIITDNYYDDSGPC